MRVIHNDINKCACIVIAAKAGIQLIQIVLSRHRRDCFRRGDGFSEFCKNLSNDEKKLVPSSVLIFKFRSSIYSVCGLIAETTLPANLKFFSYDEVVRKFFMHTKSGLFIHGKRAVIMLSVA